MKCVLASGNPHKAEEIQAILDGELELTPQSAFGVESAEETGLTFVENALLKARHAAQETGLPAIADDSGIEVPALGGRPGIYSARFAGPSASDSENLQKLLAEMAVIEDRRASFHCVIAMLSHPDDPTPIIATGVWPGRIAHSPSGNSGFGYDPIFLPRGEDCSAAEMSPDEKNRCSHRARALDMFRAQFSARYPIGSE